MARAERQSGQRRESTTQKTRSRGRSFGRLTDCLNMATCCLSARFSTAVAARPTMNALRKRKMDWMINDLYRPVIGEAEVDTWRKAHAKRR